MRGLDPRIHLPAPPIEQRLVYTYSHRLSRRGRPAIHWRFPAATREGRWMAELVHLIRHAQSTFNAAMADTPWLDPMIRDAPLSARGEAQAAALRGRAAALAVGLVVTSPLTRAIRTALAAFEGLGVPILPLALCTEKVEASQDVGRPASELAGAFPQLDFGHLPEVWWYAGGADEDGIPHEPEPAFRARVAEFRGWLRARPEHAVAVVSHGSFLQALGRHRLENVEILTMPL
jgi:broad specificity phosphatase PhoE